jgi:hypothetical protein
MPIRRLLEPALASFVGLACCAATAEWLSIVEGAILVGGFIARHCHRARGDDE